MLVISLACWLNYMLGHLGATDRLETSRPAHMRPRPELHETEIETETDYCETETEKWSRELTSLVIDTCIHSLTEKTMTGMGRDMANECKK